MNKYDIKYIFKRVIIFFIIFIILSFFKSCQVHAESYSVENTNTIARFYPSGTNSNLLWSTLYYNSNANYILSAWDFNMYMPASTTDNILYNGRYLFSYYVFGIGTFRDLKCSEMSSNFKNVNKTTGNVVQNEITSKCVDIYRTTYHGYNAYRILYEFTYTSKNGPDGIDELLFTFSSGYNPISGGSTGLNYGFEINNISDYDINTINTWNTDKSQQTIINQGQTQIQQNETIINQQTTNTNSIINNQNNNTQSVIDNQNSNTDREIESQKVCTNGTIGNNNIKIEHSILNGNGSITTTTNSSNWVYGYGITDFIKVSEINILDSSFGVNLCFYSESKLLISCSTYATLGTGIKVLPQNTEYIRATIHNDRSNLISYKSCQNGNQALNDSINDLNDNINDDNVDGANSEVDELLNNSAFNDNSGIQSIINAPLNFINGLTNSCSPINITIPYINSELSIPCIKQELTNHVPTLVPILSTAINGFVIYRILLDIVYLVKSSRNPDDDRIEVLDL